MSGPFTPTGPWLPNGGDGGGGTSGITNIVPGTDNVTVDIVDTVATISVTESGGPDRVFTNYSRSLDSVFQISADRDVAVQYSIEIRVTTSNVDGENGRVYLEYADDETMSVGRILVSEALCALGGVQGVSSSFPGNVGGYIPAGKWVRMRTGRSSSATTFDLIYSQEVLL